MRLPQAEKGRGRQLIMESEKMKIGREEKKRSEKNRKYILRRQEAYKK